MTSSLDELKARKAKGFTKPKVEYNLPGPLLQAQKDEKDRKEPKADAGS